MESLKETVDMFRSNGARRTMILCDKEMLRAGHTHAVINALLAVHMKYSLYSEALSQSMDKAVRGCMDQMCLEGVDSIIAVGNQRVIEVHQALLKSLDREYLSKDIEILCI